MKCVCETLCSPKMARAIFLVLHTLRGSCYSPSGGGLFTPLETGSALAALAIRIPWKRHCASSGAMQRLAIQLLRGWSSLLGCLPLELSHHAVRNPNPAHNSRLWSIFAVVQISPLSNSRTFPSPQKQALHYPTLSFPHILTSTIFFFFSAVDLPILDTPYKQNHTLCGL